MRSIFRVGERCGAVAPTRNLFEISTSPQGGGYFAARNSRIVLAPSADG